MHGAAFFCFWARLGGTEGKKFGFGRGGVKVKLGESSGWGRQGSLENFWGQGGVGRGGAGCASLLQTHLHHSGKRAESAFRFRRCK